MPVVPDNARPSARSGSVGVSGGARNRQIVSLGWYLVSLRRPPRLKVCLATVPCRGIAGAPGRQRGLASVFRLQKELANAGCAQSSAGGASTNSA